MVIGLKEKIWKKGRFFGLILGFSTAAVLSGCSLAREEPETGEDRLIGVFLTREYLGGGTAELKVDWKGNVSFGENSGRIPGEIRWEEGEPRVIFPEVEGYGIYQVSLREEASQRDIEHNLIEEIFGESKVNVGDEEDSMETMVYLEPGGRQNIYLNPVYQTPQGEIYLQPGTGLSWDMTAGASVSSSVAEERREKKNGEEKRKRTEFTVKVVCTVTDRPTEILLMGEEDNVLRRVSGEELERILSADEPGLRVPGETAYLIVERPEAKGGVVREICSRGEEFISFLQPWKEGYLRTEYLSVVWE